MRDTLDESIDGGRNSRFRLWLVIVFRLLLSGIFFSYSVFLFLSVEI